MDRLQEVEGKHQRLRDLLEQRGAQTLWIKRPRNLSWLTAGAEVAIDFSSETAPYSILISADKRSVIADNIELPRLRKEDHFEDLGFEFAVSSWYAQALPPMPGCISDLDDSVESELQRLRCVLTEDEQVRYRALGADAAAALEEAIRAALPGETELKIGARLDAVCRERGGFAVVNLVGSDERISEFRHPYMTGKRLERFLMIVVCMRRGGLIVAGTRFAHFGAIPAELAEKQDKVAAVDAAAMNATRAGRTLGDVFAAMQAAFASQGEAEAWKQHHQGGPIAYHSREKIAMPGDPTPIEIGQAFAWNPSLVGCKSEDTMLLGEGGFEIVTQASQAWPSLEIGIGGQTIRRPAILEV